MKINNRPKRQINVQSMSSLVSQSNVVEGRFLLLKVNVGLRGFLALAASFSNECSQSVSIPDARGFFDGARDIVVGVAELIGQKLNLVWRLLDAVIQDSVSCG